MRLTQIFNLVLYFYTWILIGIDEKRYKNGSLQRNGMAAITKTWGGVGGNHALKYDPKNLFMGAYLIFFSTFSNFVKTGVKKLIQAKLKFLTLYQITCDFKCNTTFFK